MNSLFEAVTGAMEGVAVDGARCGFETCDADEDTQLTRVEPMDPVDHSATMVVLCPDHREWVEERNELALQIRAELREARKEIGQQYLDELQEYARPDLHTPEDVLMGRDDPELPGGES